ncbi:MAG TPA: VOC family protein [Gemmatimonadales bacterium]|nr:VOC family protein [Gemmatimonadales bacterium]
MTKKSQAPKQPRQKPETLRLRDLSPSLTVSDLQASIAWYRDVVGFMVGESWEHGGKMAGVSLKAGNVYLNLSQDDWAKGRDRVKGEGVRLYLATAQDLDEIATTIKARGGTLASEPADQPWGARTFNLVDLDGYKLTFSST